VVNFDRSSSSLGLAVTRGSFALIASCLVTLPLTATAQEQLSLDEYFKGTGLEGQLNLQAADFEPLNATTPGSVAPGTAGTLSAPVSRSSFGFPPNANLSASATNTWPPASGVGVGGQPTPTSSLLPLSQPIGTPQFGFQQTLAAQPSPFGASTSNPAAYERSQLDPLTGLPLHMTSLGMGLGVSPAAANSGFGAGPITPGMLAGGLSQTSYAAPPSANWNAANQAPLARSDWSAFPTQQQPLSNGGVAQIGHTGPIVFAGAIEPLLPGETITNAALPTSVPLPEQVASRDLGLPELQDFGELSTEWLKELRAPSYDRTMDDLCVSRKGYVVLEHWGWHAASVAGRRDLLGITSVQGTFTLSFPQLVEGFTVRPQFGFHYLAGPQRTDVPTRLFDVMVEAGWMQEVWERTHLRVAGTAGLYTDFDQGNLTDGVRVLGVALGTYEVNEDLQLVLGAAIINLANRHVLPIAGVVYHPNDDVRLELMFPEGKLAQRIDPGRDHERWVYISGSFFGRTWNVARAGGGTDDLTYSDWRVGLGVESHLQTRAVWYLEVGASLGRQLEYESHVGDYDPDTTGYLRGGFYY